MEELSKAVKNLLEDLQRVTLNQLVASYSAWVSDKTLFIDCVTLGDTRKEDDINFIQLCASSGWIHKAILIPIHESYMHFLGRLGQILS